MKFMLLRYVILGMVCGVLYAGDAGQSKDLQAGDQVKFTVNGVDFEFVWCPPGTFRMGDKNSKRTVVLTHGFWIGKYEVTFEQWRVIQGCFPQPYSAPSPLWAENADGRGYPVRYISWEEGQGFLYNLNTILGIEFGFRYPTEAEWEYACRAGTQDDIAGTGNIDEMSQGDYTQKKVGQMLPNAWGIFDMHGNVCEWCYDYYQEFSEAEEVVTDPCGPKEALKNEFRVFRSGKTCYKRNYHFQKLSIDPNTLMPDMHDDKCVEDRDGKVTCRIFNEVGMRVACSGNLMAMAGKSVGKPIVVDEELRGFRLAACNFGKLLYARLCNTVNQLQQIQMNMMQQALIQQQQANQALFNNMQQQVYDNLNRIEAAHSTAITPMPQSHKPYRARCYIHNCDYQIPGSCPYCSAPDYGAGKMVPCAKHGHKYNTKYGCPLCRAESR